jgi:ATP-dependent Clp protease, protease subunit
LASLFSYGEGFWLSDAPHLLKPQVRLYGSVDDDMLRDFLRQMEEAPTDTPTVVEVMTFGGDADVGRRLALEIRLAQKHFGRVLYFLGKTVVYSAGVTLMAAFPRTSRYLTRDTVLLIHGRRMDKQVHLTGPLAASIQIARETLAQLEIGLQLEKEGFADLIAGSDITEHEICRLAQTNWYVTAEEALSRKLVAGLL